VHGQQASRHCRHRRHRRHHQVTTTIPYLAIAQATRAPVFDVHLRLLGPGFTQHFRRQVSRQRVGGGRRGAAVAALAAVIRGGGVAIIIAGLAALGAGFGLE
jgi:hypothetical protein